MPCQLLNIKKNLLINFNEIKKEKIKIKTIKYINSDLIYFEQEHNNKHKPFTLKKWLEGANWVGG